MKEFVIYTGLRLLLFVASAAIVMGVWLAISDSLQLLPALIIALVLSGVASYFLLGRQREAFAKRVQDRAERASTAFEQMKAKEDG